MHQSFGLEIVNALSYHCVWLKKLYWLYFNSLFLILRRSILCFFSCNRMNSLVKSWIYTSMSYNMVSQLVISKSIAEIWHKLLVLFLASSRTRVIDLCLQLRPSTKVIWVLRIVFCTWRWLLIILVHLVNLFQFVILCFMH